METPASKRFGSTIFWRVFAVINLVTVVWVIWVIWVIWQLVPRTVGHDFVLRLPRSAPHPRLSWSASGAIPAAHAPQSAVPEPVAPIREISIHNGPPMTPLRLDTEIKVSPKIGAGRVEFTARR